MSVAQGKNKIKSLHLFSTDTLLRYFSCFILLGLYLRSIPQLAFRFKPFYIFFKIFPIVIIAWSAVIIIKSFFSDRRMWSGVSCDIKFLFVLAYLISSLLNAQYYFINNIEFAFRIAMQLFLLSYFNKAKDLQYHVRTLDLMGTIYFGLSLFCAAGSIVMFFNGYGEAIYDLDGTTIRTGFMWDRLFGFYQDPNYGALFSVVAIIISIYLFIRLKRRLWRIVIVINIIFQYYYIVLSASRTGKVCLLFSCFFMLFGFGYFHIKRLNVVKSIFLFISCLIIAVIVVLPFRQIQDFSAYIVNFSIENGEMPTEHTSMSIGLKDNVQYMANQNKRIISTAKDESSSISIREGNVGDNQRFDSWSDQFKIFLDKPFWGTTALGYFDYAKDAYPDSFIVKAYKMNCENDLLRLLVYTGVIGTSIMLLFLGRLVLKVGLYVRKKVTTHQKYQLKPLFFPVAIILTYALASITLNTVMLNLTVQSVIFWTLIGYVSYIVDDKKGGVLYGIIDFLFKKRPTLKFRLKRR